MAFREKSNERATFHYDQRADIFVGHLFDGIVDRVVGTDGKDPKTFLGEQLVYRSHGHHRASCDRDRQMSIRIRDLLGGIDEGQRRHDASRRPQLRIPESGCSVVRVLWTVERVI